MPLLFWGRVPRNYTDFCVEPELPALSANLSHTRTPTCMLSTHASGVSLISLAICWSQRPGVLIWIWWSQPPNLLTEHTQLCTVPGNLDRRALLLLLGWHLAPSVSLFVCIWCCQHSVSNCCHLLHMFVTRCHWLSSIPSLHLCFCGAPTRSLLKRLWIMFKIILPVFPMR